MPWKPSIDALWTNFTCLKQRWQPIVGDIAFWWLNYIDAVDTAIKNVKFVCLKRPKPDTIVSFLARFEHENYWTAGSAGHDKDLIGAFPQFELPKKEALSVYYDLYYRVVEQYAKKDNFRIFNTYEVLNTEMGQRQLFEWLDLPDHKLSIGMKLNTKEDASI